MHYFQFMFEDFICMLLVMHAVMILGVSLVLLTRLLRLFSELGSPSCHHGVEFLVVNLTVPVNVCLVYHLL
jgi:hypothetical protein